MKGKDLVIFWITVACWFFAGLFIIDKSFCRYSDLIIFLSVMLVITNISFVTFYRSPLKKNFWDFAMPRYHTELHRIKGYHKYSIYFDIVSIILIIIISDNFSFILSDDIVVGKQSIVLPIIIGSVYCWSIILGYLSQIFTFPTNY